MRPGRSHHHALLLHQRQASARGCLRVIRYNLQADTQALAMQGSTPSTLASSCLMHLLLRRRTPSGRSCLCLRLSDACMCLFYALRVVQPADDLTCSKHEVHFCNRIAMGHKVLCSGLLPRALAFLPALLPALCAVHPPSNCLVYTVADETLSVLNHQSVVAGV